MLYRLLPQILRELVQHRIPTQTRAVYSPMPSVLCSVARPDQLQKWSTEACVQRATDSHLISDSSCFLKGLLSLRLISAVSPIECTAMDSPFRKERRGLWCIVIPGGHSMPCDCCHGTAGVYSARLLACGCVLACALLQPCVQLVKAAVV